MVTNGQTESTTEHLNGSVALVRLSDCRAGQTGVVHDAMLEPNDRALLRAMGLRPKARVRVCRLGEPCIVEVFGSCVGGCSCRIGLSLPLARQVMIAPE